MSSKNSPYMLLGQGPTYVLLLCCCLLTACGFHLRGMIRLPHHIQKVAIIEQSPVHRDFLIALKTLLHENHIEVVENPRSARYWLILENDKIEQTLTNVSASTIPRQYQLTYSVCYTFSKADGTPLISSHSFSVSQQSTINNNRILGSNFEARTIEHDMQEDAAEQLLYQISLYSQQLDFRQGKTAREHAL